MAFEAKDGKKFSMASRMRAHNARQPEDQTKAPDSILNQPGEHEDEGGMQQAPAEQQGLQDPQQVHAAYEQVMQQVQAGQQPDPAVADALAKYFEQFAQPEPDGDEGGDYGGEE